MFFCFFYSDLYPFGSKGSFLIARFRLSEILSFKLFSQFKLHYRSYKQLFLKIKCHLGSEQCEKSVKYYLNAPLWLIQVEWHVWPPSWLSLWSRAWKRNLNFLIFKIWDFSLEKKDEFFPKTKFRKLYFLDRSPVCRCFQIVRTIPGKLCVCVSLSVCECVWVCVSECVSVYVCLSVSLSESVWREKVNFMGRVFQQSTVDHRL